MLIAVVHQYQNAGNIENSAFYLMEAAALNLALFFPRAAYQQLQIVNRYFKEVRAGRNPFEGKVAQTDGWQPSKRDIGLMEALIGRSLFVTRETTNAMPHLRRALRLLGNPQPKTALQVCISSHMSVLLILPTPEGWNPESRFIYIAQCSVAFKRNALNCSY